jgi:peptide/nickel transport system permease protein
MSIQAGFEPGALPEPVAEALEGSPLLVDPGPLGRTSRRRPIGADIALLWLVLVVIVAVIGPWIAPYSANGIDVDHIRGGLSAHHWLGTDELGRDVMSRLLLGARSSLIGVVLAVGVALGLGGVWGLLAGYGHRAIDEVLMRLADSILSFPALVLAVAVVGALGPSLVHAMIAVGLIFAPGLARLVRGEVLKVRSTDYVQYARRYGMGPVRAAGVHVLPNIVGPVVVQTVLLSGIALIAEAGLSFLGLGPQPPSPNWGASLGAAFQYIEQSPGLMLAPGLAIVFTVLSINTVGDRLHQWLSG